MGTLIFREAWMCQLSHKTHVLSLIGGDGSQWHLGNRKIFISDGDAEN